MLDHRPLAYLGKFLIPAKKSTRWTGYMSYTSNKYECVLDDVVF